MADNKKKQTPVTLEEVMDLLTEFRNESRVQKEDLILRLETVLTRQGATKGPKKNPTYKPKLTNGEKKGKGKGKGKGNEKVLPTHFSNTMYWWAAMYASQNILVEKYFTAEEVNTAEERNAEIKDKPEGYDRSRTVGIAIWKGFAQSKKSELKTMFENWKKANAKNLAKDVEKEKHTDDDADEKETELGDVNCGGANDDDE
jgi:hypothetical protein